MAAEIAVPRDRFRAICALFLRMLQRESTEAPNVLVAPARGAQWVAAVFVGAPPAELREHYLRSGGEGSSLPARAAHLGDAHRVALAASGEAALELLEADLRRGLESRMLADQEAWLRAYGEPWRCPEIAQPTAAEPAVDLDFPRKKPRPVLEAGR
jgi:hypothetical protein